MTMDDFFPPLTDAQLVAQAQARRESNPDYRPTADELAAIDRQMIDRTRTRLRQECGPCPVCHDRYGGVMIAVSTGQECDTCEQDHTPAR